MEQSFTLRNGVVIPAVGFGTYKTVDQGAAPIEAAIKAGYRHFDTAAFYRIQRGRLARPSERAEFPEILFLSPQSCGRRTWDMKTRFARQNFH